MSRIGRMPIALPEGVEITQEGSRLRVKGPLGTLEREIHPEMKVERGDGQLMVVRPSDQPRHRALHGLTRTLVSNMVTGVTTGFTRQLEISGVGYRAQLQGQKLVLALGYGPRASAGIVSALDLRGEGGEERPVLGGGEEGLLGHHRLLRREAGHEQEPEHHTRCASHHVSNRQALNGCRGARRPAVRPAKGGTV